MSSSGGHDITNGLTLWGYFKAGMWLAAGLGVGRLLFSHWDKIAPVIRWLRPRLRRLRLIPKAERGSRTIAVLDLEDDKDDN